MYSTLDTKHGSIKGIIGTFPEQNRKRTAALVIKTLEYKSALSDVIVATKLLKEERKITSMNLALVLVHDLLLSNGIQAGDGPIKQAVLRHKTRLNGELQKIKIKRGARSTAELAQPADPRAEQIPRYVRINTTLWTAEEAIESFKARGFHFSDKVDSDKCFTRDEHIHDLLVFSPQVSFQGEAEYEDGRIILQDKASCFPAVILSPPAHDKSLVIDATAAPGNKTSHLSTLMRNRGKIFAFERDRKRFTTLQKMLSTARCKNVECLNKDFLTVDPLDPKFTNVKYILLDPSCSGSGIVNRLDYLVNSETQSLDQEDRFSKLAAFQLSIIRHAMKFPSAARIVYSTCSIHAVENERVVCQALDSEEARIGRFILAPRSEVLPSWPRRGLSDEMQGSAEASSLIRCSAGEDATNGFFVSCFVRHSMAITNLEAVAAASGNKRKEDGEGERKKRKKMRTG